MTLEQTRLSRRLFGRTLGGSAAAALGCALFPDALLRAAESPAPMPPVSVFSKIYQELKLDFDQSAKLTAAAGLDGIDCAVREKGEIEPERAADQMPQYAEALGRQGVKMLLVTSGILGVDSPHARDVLRATKKLGIRYYRLGFWHREENAAPEKQIAEIKARLKELAALNRELGVCALFENHSALGTKVGTAPETNKSSGMVGGDLGELHEIVSDFDPDQIAVAFDLGHAIIMHGDGWRQHFERLKKHIRVAYIKDVGRSARFMPFGEGEFGKTDFFTQLKKMNYNAPFSLHLEYDWAEGGKKTSAAMIAALTRCRRVLGQWWERG